MLKSFMYKLGSWLVGFLMFNTLWLFLVMTVDVVLPRLGCFTEIGLIDIRWVPFTLICWAGLKLIIPFDAFVFMKKVEEAFEEASGMNKEPEPEVWTELVIEEEEPVRKPEPEKQKTDPA